MTKTDWKTLTVVELKEACTQRGIDTAGRKSDLIKKLEDYDTANPSEEMASASDNEADVETVKEEADEEMDEEQAEEEEQEEQEDEEKEEEETEEETKKQNGEKKDDKKKPKSDKKLGRDDFPDLDFETLAKACEEAEKSDRKYVMHPLRPKLKNDVLTMLKLRQVRCGPFTQDVISTEEIQNYLSECDDSNLKFKKDDDGSLQVWMQFTFPSIHRAHDVVASSEVIKPPEDEEQRKLLDNIFSESSIDDLTKHALFMEGIPKSITDEEDLRESFPEADTIVLSRDKDEHPQGYGYLLFKTNEKSKELLERVNEDPINLDESRLYIEPYVPGRDRDQVEREERGETQKVLVSWYGIIRRQGKQMSDELRTELTEQIRCLEKKMKWKNKFLVFGDGTFDRDRRWQPNRQGGSGGPNSQSRSLLGRPMGPRIMPQSGGMPSRQWGGSHGGMMRGGESGGGNMNQAMSLLAGIGNMLNQMAGSEHRGSVPQSLMSQGGGMPQSLMGNAGGYNRGQQWGNKRMGDTSYNRGTSKMPRSGGGDWNRRY